MNLFWASFYVLDLLFVVANTQFDLQSQDHFQNIREKLDTIDPSNCDIVDINELFLPRSTVTHIPNVKTLRQETVFPNRTNLLHVHNMALSKAFFYSFILQKASDDAEPGMMYYLLSAISDVAANKVINASAIYYGPNMAFTPSYKNFYNKTMPLFAPRAYRGDDFKDPTLFHTTSTLNTIIANDLGAIERNYQSHDYTNKHYRTNEFYTHWLPDYTQRHDSKPTYNIHITYSNGSYHSFFFHGPPRASDEKDAVLWTRPYYDCGRSNKWLLAATSPIIDLNPRNTGWRHIEYPRNVAASVMEIDFERLDINQCPAGGGNQMPNYFAGTAKCKNETTDCEPIDGFGFRRGGYQCRCKPGHRLPKSVRYPYLGEIIERATEFEYKKGFKCEKVGYIAVRTQNQKKMSLAIAQRLIGEMKTFTGLSRNSSFPLDVKAFLDNLNNISKDCSFYLNKRPELLTLRGDVAYGQQFQFENQARMALRLANFLSAFFQVIRSNRVYQQYRLPDSPLTVDQLIGEVLSIVIADLSIEGVGILFDVNKFPNKTYFAPYAYKDNEHFKVNDLSIKPIGLNKYTEDEWFKIPKIRWSVNTDKLTTFTSKIKIRYNATGINTVNFDEYPLRYKAADLNDGHWSSPHFACNSYHNMWLLSYSVPFFGWNSIKSKLEFRGAVVVKMNLLELDINQCNDDYYVNNAFKNTHKCDRASSRCVPMLGRKFKPGGYKCECLQGYEYPFYDLVTYVDGQNLESEYLNLEAGEPTRFDTLRCRMASCYDLKAKPFLILSLILFIILIIR